ncbi:helix-turn-helix domain-containing protein [Acetobacter senegalensis]|uniref:helix-turn-helix domain-containing protein n=1 Tax=Acetobacter senegalensis TaxID=446692 RepID=UPI0020A180E1|nr:helix-turn-helix transcriptional regulator [Acetobacter senegalensis]MCP1196772.1 helix-turn-helix domain-containing protein [Acetobacter senegalensis]
MAKKPKETQANARLFKDGLLYRNISRTLTEQCTRIGITPTTLSKLSGIHLSTIKYFRTSQKTGKPFSVATFFGLTKALQLDFDHVLPPHGGALVPFPEPLTQEDVDTLLVAAKSLENSKPDLLKLMRTLSDMARPTNPAIDETTAVFAAEAGFKVAPPGSLETLIMIGRRVRSLRIVRGWGRAELRTASGVPFSSVFAIEAGLQNPSMQTLYQLAEALSAPVSFFFKTDVETERDQLDLERRAASIIASGQIGSVNEMLSTVEYLFRTATGTPPY